jgi:hypothetical protein
MNKQEESGMLLGMIMLKEEQSFDTATFYKDFQSNYSHNLKEPRADKTLILFEVQGETAAVSMIGAPIPLTDIEQAAKYSYNWPTAEEDLKKHKSHLIVSLTTCKNDPIKCFRLFTEILCSLLTTTVSHGVYLGSTSLLIPKADYLSEAQLMSEVYLPLNLWIYFGLKVTKEGNCGHTYGCTQFNKKELEIVNSTRNLDEIRGFLFNTAHYILEHDVQFKPGETIGISPEESILIDYSKGHSVSGESFKFFY